jgi:hypothetical protein
MWPDIVLRVLLQVSDGVSPLTTSKGSITRDGHVSLGTFWGSLALPREALILLITINALVILMSRCREKVSETLGYSLEATVRKGQSQACPMPQQRKGAEPRLCPSTLLKPSLWSSDIKPYDKGLVSRSCSSAQCIWICELLTLFRQALISSLICRCMLINSGSTLHLMTFSVLFICWLGKVVSLENSQRN